MLKIIKNDKGLAMNIALAMVLVAVATSSLISLIDLVNKDRYTVVWLQDRLQQEMLMRAEMIRINYLLGTESTVFPPRRVEIAGKDRVATYTLSHQQDIAPYPSFLGETSQAARIQTMCTTRYGRRMFTNAASVTSPIVSFSEKLSRRSSLARFQWFTDKEMSDITNDPDNPAAWVRFNGDDLLRGPIHSNDYIYVQNNGSNVAGNQGWPKFLAKVTTAKEIRAMQGTTAHRPLTNAEKQTIFPGGLDENVGAYAYFPEAIEIRQKGQKPFGNEPDQTLAIVKAEIDGRSVNFQVASINPQWKNIEVYNSYPDAVHAFQPTPQSYYANPWQTWGSQLINDPVTNTNKAPFLVGDQVLHTSRVAFPDTTWTTGNSITLNDDSAFIPSTLWVKGEVNGKMTLASMFNAYTIGHITYANTVAGQAPDDPDAPNRLDYFGLVSEGKILIKYKYKDPETGEKINTPNAVGPTGIVYLYGAFSAQGAADPTLGEFAYKAEGSFTYEYQHPHGSPIPFWGYRYKRNPQKPAYANPMDFVVNAVGDTIPVPVLIENIDMHRFKYPPDGTSNSLPYWRRWPGITSGVENASAAQNGFAGAQSQVAPPQYWNIYDYPWYNPVYPEQVSELVWTRGTLYMFGALAQRRRGYMRRSGTMRADNPDTQNYWDLETYNPDNVHRWEGGRFVYAGAHPATGYDRIYSYDRRFLWVQPPHYPQLYGERDAGMMTKFDESSWVFKAPPKNWYGARE